MPNRRGAHFDRITKRKALPRDSARFWQPWLWQHCGHCGQLAMAVWPLWSAPRSNLAALRQSAAILCAKRAISANHRMSTLLMASSGQSAWSGQSSHVYSARWGRGDMNLRNNMVTSYRLSVPLFFLSWIEAQLKLGWGCILAFSSCSSPVWWDIVFMIVYIDSTCGMSGFWAACLDSKDSDNAFYYDTEHDPQVE